MNPRPAVSTLVAAPIVSAARTALTFGEREQTLDCLYVEVDAKARPDVANFLAGWRRCCDAASIDWRSVRRPQSALVGIELRACCDERAESLRLVFDIRRDRAALDALVETEALVVGNRPYGRFANSIAAYGIDGSAVRAAMKAAHRSLEQLNAYAS
ncbi:MAG TPA: hypothetical protein VM345_06505 [Acidimicrobiales bacterium]|jgi:hypothetical protein|nr:hypothetical protein [Acidimicrobiales bacterium]